MPKSHNPQTKSAVILLSGGLDSATCLAIAKDQGFDCYALSFQYGQRHAAELKAAQNVTRSLGVIQHHIVTLDTALFAGSALTNKTLSIPQDRLASDQSAQNRSPKNQSLQDSLSPSPASPTSEIPITYVPARNTVFLSMALAWAEVLHAQSIFIGANVVDYSGYPDCRPEYLKAFETMANLATKAGVEGNRLTIEAPLLHLTKAQIIQTGDKLGLDYGLTISCYQAEDHGHACGRCDSCHFRRQGFLDADIPDPTKYQ